MRPKEERVLDLITPGTVFYIYEIPGKKIGCSTNAKSRTRQQGSRSYRLLEQHTDIFEATRRELELQSQFGYKVDRVPYWISFLVQREKRMKYEQKYGKNTNIASFMNIDQRIENCQKAGRMAVITQREQKIGAFFNPETRNRLNHTKYRCPDDHVSSLAHYRAYCIKHGLDPALAVKIENNT